MSSFSQKTESKDEHRLLTIPEAAAQLGVPVSTLRHATNAGLVPTHTLFNQRKRVRLSEVLAAIQSVQEG